MRLHERVLMLLTLHLVLALNKQVQDILANLVIVLIEELVDLQFRHQVVGIPKTLIRNYKISQLAT